MIIKAGNKKEMQNSLQNIEEEHVSGTCIGKAWRTGPECEMCMYASGLNTDL